MLRGCPRWLSFQQPPQMSGGPSMEVQLLSVPSDNRVTARHRHPCSLTFHLPLPNRLSQPDLRPCQRQPPPLPVPAGPAGKAPSKAPGPRWARQLRALAGAVCPELPGRAALLGGACVQPLGDAGRGLLGTDEAQAGAPHGQHRPRAQLLGALHSGGLHPGLAQREGPAPPSRVRAAPGRGFEPGLWLPHLLQPGTQDPTPAHLPCRLHPAPLPHFLAPRGSDPDLVPSARGHPSSRAPERGLGAQRRKAGDECHPGGQVPPFPWAPEPPQLLPWGPEATALVGPVVGWKTNSGAGWATWKEAGGSLQTGVHLPLLSEGGEAQGRKMGAQF